MSERERALEEELRRVRQLHTDAIAEAQRLIGERDDARALALKLADWAGYWQSGCADAATLAELRGWRKS